MMRLLLLNLVLASAGLLGCAGYQIGARSMFRPDVSTVHVAMVHSEDYRRFMGERLTEALVKRIESATPYKVVGPEGADTILEVTLASMTKRVLAETRNDDPRNLEAALQARVSWVRSTGEPLMQPSSYPFATSQLTIRQAANFIPEGGQSVSTAQQVAIDRLAAQIVEQMELSFQFGP